VQRKSSATRNRCYRHPLPALRGRLPARQRTNPHEPWQAKALAPPGGPFGHLSVCFHCCWGGIRDGMTRGEDEPEPDGSCGADRGPRAARQGRQPSGLASGQPRLDELMRRRLVLHRLPEAEERLAPPGASKRSHRWHSQKLTSLTLLLALIWSFRSPPTALAPAQAPARHNLVLLLGMPGRPVAGSGRYRGLPEVHVLLGNPQVELVPCRRRQIGFGVGRYLQAMEEGTRP
jgi:hypothetical protein